MIVRSSQGFSLAAIDGIRYKHRWKPATNDATMQPLMTLDSSAPHEK
jgi:hypothetical protein